MPAIFNQSDKYPALYDTNRNPTHVPPAIATLALGTSGLTDEELVANNISVMFNSLIKPTTQTLFFGAAPPNE